MAQVIKILKTDLDAAEENFDAIREEIGTLQAASLVTGLRISDHIDGPMPYEKRKAFAESLSIDLDKVRMDAEEGGLLSKEPAGATM